MVGGIVAVYLRGKVIPKTSKETDYLPHRSGQEGEKSGQETYIKSIGDFKHVK